MYAIVARKAFFFAFARRHIPCRALNPVLYRVASPLSLGSRSLDSLHLWSLRYLNILARVQFLVSSQVHRSVQEGHHIRVECLPVGIGEMVLLGLYMTET